MIASSIIKDICSALGTAISCKIIRSNQQGNKPDYPYGTYNVLAGNNESAHSNVKTTEAKPGDTTKAIVTTRRKSDDTVSFNFLDKDRADRIADRCNEALQWFADREGVEFCKSKGVRVLLIQNAIQDRTAFFDTYFENKYGFDVRFLASTYSSGEIEAVQTVTIGQERDGESQPDIAIDIT